MAQAADEILASVADRIAVTGLVSVPEDCVRKLDRIRLVAGRPAAVNEPTSAGVAATEEMLRLVSRLGPDDLCICLLSGGGSALLPAPLEGISLDAKTHLIRSLSDRGADIVQLNRVRQQLSRFKGGGLARNCRGARLITLILSDVLGDPLDIIASGPTCSSSATPAHALEILKSFGLDGDPAAAAIVSLLRGKAGSAQVQTRPRTEVTNLIIGNNATAVDAAAQQAVKYGFNPAAHSGNKPEGLVTSVASHLVSMATTMQVGLGPDCLISGGEPTVQLADRARRGKGGRNQQLALAALRGMRALPDTVLLSGGTDGEDGPTKAAGAIVDAELDFRAAELGLDIADYLDRNDAYHFFQKAGGLLETGPTGTNVCDVRVVLTNSGRKRVEV